MVTLALLVAIYYQMAVAWTLVYIVRTVETTRNTAIPMEKFITVHDYHWTVLQMGIVHERVQHHL